MEYASLIVDEAASYSEENRYEADLSVQEYLDSLLFDADAPETDFVRTQLRVGDLLAV